VSAFCRTAISTLLEYKLSLPKPVVSRFDDLLRPVDIPFDAGVAAMGVEGNHQGLNGGCQFVNRRTNVSIDPLIHSVVGIVRPGRAGDFNRV
jgi:hypothetical protein